MRTATILILLAMLSGCYQTFSPTYDWERIDLEE